MIAFSMYQRKGIGNMVAAIAIIHFIASVTGLPIVGDQSDKAVEYFASRQAGKPSSEAPNAIETASSPSYLITSLPSAGNLLETDSPFPIGSVLDSSTSQPLDASHTGKDSGGKTNEEKFTSDVFEYALLDHHGRQAAPIWTYKDTGSWANAYPTCNGNRQSPIDIQPRLTALKAYPKFKFVNYGYVDRMVLTNNGHTALYSLPTTLPSDRTPYITGGGLEGAFNLVQFHLHWGSDSSRGSEHLIKSKSYPAELHMVHYNTKYGTFAEASKHEDGIAVLGIFIKIGLEDSATFAPLVDQMGEMHENEEITLTSMVALQDLLPQRTTSFYRYSGSLTTPACQQIVTWTLFDIPITISERQLAKFRHLKAEDGTPLVDNYRPTQPLDGREVTYRSYTGCEISKTWPITSSPFFDAMKWSRCLMGFAIKSLFFMA